MPDHHNLTNDIADRYPYHRLALLPLVSEKSLATLEAAQQLMSQEEQESFLKFIINNGLGPLWFDLLQQNKQSFFLLPQTRELRNITSYTASLYMYQRNSLEKIESIFNGLSIPYVIFKGAHTREIVYPNPALRYACDIDILISERNKAKVIKGIQAAGFMFHPDKKNISHEATLTDRNTTIDLHWNILRPGRTRINITEKLLESRQKYSTHWGPDDATTLFLMLVHPVFSEYATTPYSSLLRVVDMVKWLQQRKPDWDKVISLLEQTGLKTAAWVMLSWLQELLEPPFPQNHIVKRLKPGPFRSRYLDRWIQQDYSTRLRHTPLLIQTLFTLPVHDSLSDAIHAVRTRVHEKRIAAAKLERLLAEIQ